MTLVKCPKCDTWALPTEDEAWCSVHGAIPLPHDRREPPHERGQK